MTAAQVPMGVPIRAQYFKSRTVGAAVSAVAHIWPGFYTPAMPAMLLHHGFPGVATISSQNRSTAGSRVLHSVRAAQHCSGHVLACAHIGAVCKGRAQKRKRLIPGASRGMQDQELLDATSICYPASVSVDNSAHPLYTKITIEVGGACAPVQGHRRKAGARMWRVTPSAGYTCLLPPWPCPQLCVVCWWCAPGKHTLLVVHAAALQL